MMGGGQGFFRALGLSMVLVFAAGCRAPFLVPQSSVPWGPLEGRIAVVWSGVRGDFGPLDGSHERYYSVDREVLLRSLVEDLNSSLVKGEPATGDVTVFSLQSRSDEAASANGAIAQFFIECSAITVDREAHEVYVSAGWTLEPLPRRSVGAGALQGEVRGSCGYDSAWWKLPLADVVDLEECFQVAMAHLRRKLCTVLRENAALVNQWRSGVRDSDARVKCLVVDCGSGEMVDEVSADAREVREDFTRSGALVGAMSGREAVGSGLAAALQDMRVRSGRVELFVVYLAGLGTRGGPDAEIWSPTGYRVSLSGVADAVEAAVPEEVGVVLFIDAGFSDGGGAAVRSSPVPVLPGSPAALGLGSLSRRANWAVVLPSGPGKPAFRIPSRAEQDSTTRHGLFAFFMLSGLRGLADGVTEGAEGKLSVPDGVVSVRELVAFSRREVGRAARAFYQSEQEPVLFGNGELRLRTGVASVGR